MLNNIIQKITLFDILPLTERKFLYKLVLEKQIQLTVIDSYSLDFFNSNLWKLKLLNVEYLPDTYCYNCQLNILGKKFVS